MCFSESPNFKEKGENKTEKSFSPIGSRKKYAEAQTTDAQRGNNLHCMAKNLTPIPNF